MTEAIDYDDVNQAASTAESQRKQPGGPAMADVIAKAMENPAVLAAAIQQAQSGGAGNGEPAESIDYEALGQVPEDSGLEFVRWQETEVLDNLLVVEIEKTPTLTDKFPPKDNREVYLKYYCTSPDADVKYVFDNKKRSLMKPLAQLNIQVGDTVRIERLCKGEPGVPYRFRLAKLGADGQELESAEG